MEKLTRWCLRSFLIMLLMSSMLSATVTNINTAENFATIQAAIDDAETLPGHTLQVSPGTYVLSSTITVTKANLTIDGAGGGDAVIQASTAVGYAFSLTASGVTIRDLVIQKTDLGTGHALIYIAANNLSILNNLIYGPDPGSPWSVNGIVSRAMISTGGLSGLLVDGNTIHTLRQPGYFSGPTTGTISNNAVSGTRGWVNEGAQLTFTNNSWPLPANQGAEIALLAFAVDPAWYPDLIALSNANNNAYISAQFVGGDDGRATAYVDDSAAPGGLGSSLAPFQTISAGVAGVLRTGTVNVAAGTYVDNVTVTDPMTITGAGALTTVFRPALSAPNPGGGGSLPPGASNMVLVQANDVTIAGMTIDGDNPSLTSGQVFGGADIDARNGIITNHLVGVYNNLVVHDCTIKNIWLRGLYASSGGSFNFYNNAVNNVKADLASIGIFNFGGSGTITNNTVSNCNDAISANWSTGTTFTFNTVSSSGSGIHTDNAGNSGSPDLIENNSVSDSPVNGYGIFVFAPYQAPVVNLNTITNVDVGLTCAGSYAAVTPVFTNNTVNGMAKANSTGIYITTEIWGFTSGNVSVSFENNSIINNVDGMYVVAEAGFTNTSTFFNNEFHTNSNSNVLAGVGGMGAGTFALQMSGNYWGSTDPGVVDASIQSNADYTPWLASGVATSPGFDGDFSVLYVDDNSPQIGSVNRVQEAVDMVSGSTIYLMPGLYVGQVVCTGFADLNIIGAGQLVTTIQAPATAMTHSFVTSGPNNNFAVLSIENSADVDVQDLTIDGAGKGNLQYRFIGAAYRNSGGSMSDITVKDVRDNPLSGAQHGNAVYSLCDDGNPRTLDLARVTTIGFQKTGIVLNGADLTANVSECTVTGAGPLGLGLPAQNGIQFGTGADGSISDCIVSGISYTPAAYVATGLLLFGPGPVVTSGNTITDVETGAYFIDAAGSYNNTSYSASSVGTGVTDYYGAYFWVSTLAKANHRQPQGFDTEGISSNKLTTVEGTALAPMATTIMVNNNIFIGDNGVNSLGFGAYTDGTSNLVISATGNRVTNFNYGIDATETGSSSLTTNLVSNDVLFNGLGFGNSAGSVSATQNVFANTANASDNTAGNFYNQNCWSDWSGIGTYAVPGGGANVDNNPVADCGLDMSPNTIVYNCVGDFNYGVFIGEGVTALDAANIWLAYPAELAVSSVTALDANFFVAYTQTSHGAGQLDTLKVNLGVLTGVDDGPDSLFRITMNGSTSCLSGDIVMIYRDLRDSTNTQIPAPLASPIDFQSNCVDPTIVVNSPASGGFYNVAPVLSLTANDDCDLNSVYYQIDGCAPAGWLPIATGLSGMVYNNAAWSMTGAEFNALTEASHCIRFKVTDDYGRGNSDSCTYTWCFTKDVTPPAAPTSLVAQPGHNKIQLSWVNSSSAGVVGVKIQRVQWTDYPNYGSLPTPTAAPVYPANHTVGLTVHDVAATPSLPASHLDVMSLSNATRDIYYYGAFAYDAAGNYSAAAVSAQARSTSYWLGDIAAAFDGSVYFTDLVVFTGTYGVNHGQPGFVDHADFGPTHNNSPKGIPLPDDKVEFEDLAIFAINFNNVSPMMAKNSPTLSGAPVSNTANLRLVDRLTADGYFVDLVLDNRSNDSKSLIGEISFDPSQLSLVSSTIGEDIANPSLPLFFKSIVGESKVSISAAVLGEGLAFTGSGTIATLKFQTRTATPLRAKLTRADIRDNANSSIIAPISPVGEPETITAQANPSGYSISQNSPNPFNPDTKIAYGLPAATKVSIRIYNVMGQLVKSLVDEYQPAGTYEAIWNGTNDSGEKVASGIYFYRFETADFQKTVKMTMLK